MRIGAGEEMEEKLVLLETPDHQFQTPSQARTNETPRIDRQPNNPGIGHPGRELP
jgi:hypothetical protein